MQPLLGLFFFSVLLATGFSLECDNCLGKGNSCSGLKLTCADGLNTCFTIVAELTIGGQKTTGITKGCVSKDVCDKQKPGGTFTISGLSGTIKSVKCKAPSPSASLLLALSGLLLLKVFF